MATNQPPAVTIRCDLRPGDLGLVTGKHGELYAAEYGFDWRFEAYVAATLAEFVEQFDPQRDRLWIASRDGEFAGSIGVIGRDAGQAQLRWLLVHPETRGQGLGWRLIHELIDFCQRAGYSSIYLWTVDVLHDATRLYHRAGFRKTETKPPAPLWGRTLREERYDLWLEGRP